MILNSIWGANGRYYPARNLFEKKAEMSLVLPWYYLSSPRRKRGFGERTRLCRRVKPAPEGSYSETFPAAEDESFSFYPPRPDE